LKTITTSDYTDPLYGVTDPNGLILDLSFVKTLNLKSLRNTPAEIESFFKLLVSKLVQINVKSVVFEIFEWTELFLNNLNIQNIAALKGIFSSLDLKIDEHLLNFQSLHDILFSSEFQSLLVLAINKASDMKQLQPEYNIFSLYEYYLAMIRKSLYATITNDSEEFDFDFINLQIEQIEPPSDSYRSYLKKLQTQTENPKFRALLIENERDQEVSPIFISTLHLYIFTSIIIAEFDLSVVFNFITNCELLNEYSLDFYIAAIESLGLINELGPISSQKLSVDTVNFLEKFLFVDEIFLVYSEFQTKILREVVCQNLVKVLDSLYKNGFQGSLKNSLLFGSINKMHLKQDPEQELRSKVIHGNSIGLISHLSRVLKPQDTIQQIMPAIARRIEESKDSKILWNAVANIGMTNDYEIFKTVIEYTLDHDVTKNTLSVLLDLATISCRPFELLEFYLEKLLLLFIEKANQNTRNLQELFELTKIVQVLLHHDEFQLDQNPELINQLRKFWFLLIIYVLQNGQFTPEWSQVLKSIAADSPSFCIDPKEKSLIFNLESDSVLIANYPPEVVSRMYNILWGYHPQFAVEIRTFSFPVIVYLIMIKKVEMLRMKNLSLDYICGYLVSDRFHSIYPIIESIADSILKTTIRDSFYKKLPEFVIENHLKTLLMYSANRNPNVRKFLSTWIKKLLNVVPKMLFSRNAFNHMLDILLFLDIELTYKKESIFILEYSSIQEKTEVGLDFLRLCDDWCQTALKISSFEILPILESYLMELNGEFPWLSTGQMTSDKHSLMLKLCQGIYTMNDFSAPMIRYSTTRANYLGEVRGMIAMIELTNPEKTRDEIIKQISKKCAKDLRKLFKDQGSPRFISVLHVLLCRAAAVIILGESYEPQLIQLICNTPGVKFTPIVVELTMETVSWLMAVKPLTDADIFGYMVQVWESIAIQKLGIYSPDVSSGHPFENIMSYGPPKCPEVKGFDIEMNAHMVWIEFFVERFKFDRLGSSDCLSRYTRFFTTACHPRFKMNDSFLALNVRLDLISLGTRIGKELSRRGEQGALFVWYDVFRITCNLFEKEPCYGVVLKKDLVALYTFYNSFKRIEFDKITNMFSDSLFKSAFLPGMDGDRGNQD
jgi:hypothetical protein